MRALALVLCVLVVAAPAGAGPARSDTRLVSVRIYAPRGAPGASCDRVLPLRRDVRSPAVLTNGLRALLRGPTRAERRKGYGGWFSARTAGMLRSASVGRGTARIDFVDFSRVIPNASSSCGSALLLAQLDRTAMQFPTVQRAVYSFDGSVRAFYAWLQRSPP